MTEQKLYRMMVNVTKVDMTKVQPNNIKYEDCEYVLNFPGWDPEGEYAFTADRFTEEMILQMWNGQTRFFVRGTLGANGIGDFSWDNETWENPNLDPYKEYIAKLELLASTIKEIVEPEYPNLALQIEKFLNE